MTSNIPETGVVLLEYLGTAAVAGVDLAVVVVGVVGFFVVGVVTVVGVMVVLVVVVVVVGVVALVVVDNDVDGVGVGFVAFGVVRWLEVEDDDRVEVEVEEGVAETVELLRTVEDVDDVTGVVRDVSGMVDAVVVFGVGSVGVEDRAVG